MVSVIVCTYNREELLAECLNSLMSQSVSRGLFEVIVVDNMSTDHTSDLCQRYCASFTNIKYVLEPQKGLSTARNRGFLEAQFDWVAYIDDDAKAYSDYIARMLSTIERFGFDCFGGMYFAWYRGRKPNWIPDAFGTKELVRVDVGIMPSGHFASGGNIVFRKSVLSEVGGFSPSLGMKGNKLGYGEEDFVQEQILKLGYTIGFDPELKIDHLVSPNKYSLRWHLLSEFAKGKSLQKMGRESVRLSTLVKTVIIETSNAIGLMIKERKFSIKYFLYLALKSPINYLGRYLS